MVCLFESTSILLWLKLDVSEWKGLTPYKGARDSCDNLVPIFEDLSSFDPIFISLVFWDEKCELHEPTALPEMRQTQYQVKNGTATPAIFTPLGFRNVTVCLSYLYITCSKNHY